MWTNANECLVCRPIFYHFNIPATGAYIVYFSIQVIFVILSESKFVLNVVIKSTANNIHLRLFYLDHDPVYKKNDVEVICFELRAEIYPLKILGITITEISLNASIQMWFIYITYRRMLFFAF